MELKPEELTDAQITKEFEDHACEGENCEICLEYTRRFDPERAIELGWDEDPRLDDM